MLFSIEKNCVIAFDLLGQLYVFSAFSTGNPLRASDAAPLTVLDNGSFAWGFKAWVQSSVPHYKHCLKWKLFFKTGFQSTQNNLKALLRPHNSVCARMRRTSFFFYFLYLWYHNWYQPVKFYGFRNPWIHLMSNKMDLCLNFTLTGIVGLIH